MKLTGLTITGADDGVEHADLFELQRDFPFLELGVLYAFDRLGTPRYPSSAWYTKLTRNAESRSVAVHLCGRSARGAMAGIFDGLPWIPEAWRIQLNGFSRFKLPGLLLAHARKSEVVLQCQDDNAVDEASCLHVQHHNVSILWDPSGGRGIDNWNDTPYPMHDHGPRCGWAGGLTAENIVDRIKKVMADNDLPSLRRAECWFDLETGARTDDRFDLTKVRRILELTAPLVSASA